MDLIDKSKTFSSSVERIFRARWARSGFEELSPMDALLDQSAYQNMTNLFHNDREKFNSFFSYIFSQTGVYNKEDSVHLADLPCAAAAAGGATAAFYSSLLSYPVNSCVGVSVIPLLGPPVALCSMIAGKDLRTSLMLGTVGVWGLFTSPGVVAAGSIGFAAGAGAGFALGLPFAALHAACGRGKFLYYSNRIERVFKDNSVNEAFDEQRDELWRHIDTANSISELQGLYLKIRSTRALPPELRNLETSCRIFDRCLALNNLQERDILVFLEILKSDEARLAAAFRKFDGFSEDTITFLSQHRVPKIASLCFDNLDAQKIADLELKCHILKKITLGWTSTPPTEGQLAKLEKCLGLLQSKFPIEEAIKLLPGGPSFIDTNLRMIEPYMLSPNMTYFDFIKSYVAIAGGVSRDNMTPKYKMNEDRLLQSWVSERILKGQDNTSLYSLSNEARLYVFARVLDSVNGRSLSQFELTNLLEFMIPAIHLHAIKSKFRDFIISIVEKSDPKCIYVCLQYVRNHVNNLAMKLDIPLIEKRHASLVVDGLVTRCIEGDSKVRSLLFDKHSPKPGQCSVCFEGQKEIVLSCLSDNCEYQVCTECEPSFETHIKDSKGGIFDCPVCSSKLPLSRISEKRSHQDPEKSAQADIIYRNTIRAWHAAIFPASKDCKTANCQNRLEIRNIDTSTRHIACGSCGETTCWDCGHDHRGIEKCADAVDMNLLQMHDPMSHIRPCPSCLTPIEKTEACDSMNCTSCGTKFHWTDGLPMPEASHTYNKGPRRYRVPGDVNFAERTIYTKHVVLPDPYADLKGVDNDGRNELLREILTENNDKIIAAKRKLVEARVEIMERRNTRFA